MYTQNTLQIKNFELDYNNMAQQTQPTIKQYSISSLKYKHAEVLQPYIEVETSETSKTFPEYLPEVMEESNTVQIKILHAIRAIMKNKKKLQTKVLNPDQPEEDEEDKRKKLMNRVKVGALYDDYARIKRFMLIYVSVRLDTIQKHFFKNGWEEESIKSKYAKHERRYVQKYKKIIANYSRNMDLDIFSDFEPPNEFFEEVRVTRSFGDLMTEKGEIVALEPGAVHRMPKKMKGSLVRMQMMKTGENN